VYIHSTPKEEYELFEISRFKATMKDDYMLAVLYHHWLGVTITLRPIDDVFSMRFSSFS
jgi:hypothetical protein